MLRLHGEKCDDDDDLVVFKRFEGERENFHVRMMSESYDLYAFLCHDGLSGAREENRKDVDCRFIFNS